MQVRRIEIFKIQKLMCTKFSMLIERSQYFEVYFLLKNVIPREKIVGCSNNSHIIIQVSIVVCFYLVSTEILDEIIFYFKYLEIRLK